MTIRTVLGLGLAAAALAFPTASASAAPVCLGAQDTGGVCAEATVQFAVTFHVEDPCVTTPVGCTRVPYPVVDDVWVGQPTVGAYCYGALDRAFDCPS
ncbi:MAG TPA: hypothetical protein VNQ77_14625 [Frankiaceae bacterium]|nr:hypothetical protein [Frankiaceae bacterium]